MQIGPAYPLCSNAPPMAGLCYDMPLVETMPFPVHSPEPTPYAFSSDLSQALGMAPGDTSSTTVVGGKGSEGWACSQNMHGIRTGLYAALIIV